MTYIVNRHKTPDQESNVSAAFFNHSVVVDQTAAMSRVNETVIHRASSLHKQARFYLTARGW